MPGRVQLLLPPLFFLAACRGDDLTLPGTGDPTLTIVAGDQQTAAVGEFVPEPLVVRLVDGAGNPIAGATVSFRFSEAVPDAQVSPSAPATDQRGEAGANARLGSQAGDQPIQAVVTMPDGSLEVLFRLTALAKPGGGPGVGGGGGGDDGGGGSAGPPPPGGGDPPGDGGGAGGGNGGSGGNGNDGGNGNGGNGGNGGGNGGGGGHHDNGGKDHHDKPDGGKHHDDDGHGHHGKGGGGGNGGGHALPASA